MYAPFSLREINESAEIRQSIDLRFYFRLYYNIINKNMLYKFENLIKINIYREWMFYISALA